MNLRELARQQQSEQQGPQEPRHEPQQIGAAAAALPLRQQQERERAAAAAAAAVYKEYQENIKRGESLRTGIIKGLEAGENPYKLLYMAAECIGCMMGETKVFAATVKDLIKEVYGDALQEPRATVLELEEVRARLAMLRRPDLKRTRNINAAIMAYERRERELMTLQAEKHKK